MKPDDVLILAAGFWLVVAASLLVAAIVIWFI
jgi:hypothetical protein